MLIVWMVLVVLMLMLRYKSGYNGGFDCTSRRRHVRCCRRWCRSGSRDRVRVRRSLHHSERNQSNKRNSTNHRLLLFLLFQCQQRRAFRDLQQINVKFQILQGNISKQCARAELSRTRRSSARYNDDHRSSLSQPIATQKHQPESTQIWAAARYQTRPLPP